MKSIKVWLTAGLLAMGLASPAMAQRYDRGSDRGGRDVGRIEGLSVRAAQDNLRYGGFTPARSVKLNGQQWDLWASGRSCFGFTSYKGTVTSSNRFDDSACAFGITDRRGDRDWNDRNRDDGHGFGGGRFEARTLVGLRVDDGKRQLSYSGYQGARSISLRGQQWDLWRGRDACVGFTSYYGQITDAQRFPDDQCWR